MAAAQLILHPFRFTTTGGVATAAQGSDDYLDSQLRVVLGTRLGERDMVTPYGIPDPTFAVLAAPDIQTCLDRYGPDDMLVTTVVNTIIDDTTVHSTVTWTRRSSP